MILRFFQEQFSSLQENRFNYKFDCTIVKNKTVIHYSTFFSPNLKNMKLNSQINLIKLKENITQKLFFDFFLCLSKNVPSKTKCVCAQHFSQTCVRCWVYITNGILEPQRKRTHKHTHINRNIGTINASLWFGNASDKEAKNEMSTMRMPHRITHRLAELNAWFGCNMHQVLFKLSIHSKMWFLVNTREYIEVSLLICICQFWRCDMLIVNAPFECYSVWNEQSKHLDYSRYFYCCLAGSAKCISFFCLNKQEGWFVLTSYFK